ncbi:type III-B CRISPR module-associated protein Cmr3 [Thermus sp.]
MLIEPRDPLIVRDGRPFTNNPGARAKSLPFPLPQTLAGAYRTRRALLKEFPLPERAEEVLRWGLRGPLLAEGGQGGWRLMVPRPLDALKLGEAVYPLRPLKLPQGAGTNLPEGLYPVGLQSPSLKEKPAPLEAFWYWESFLKWLLEDAPEGFSPEGHGGPTPETRTHVALDPTTQTAREGFLFQTSGLEFARGERAFAQGQLGRVRKLALVLWPDGEELEGVFPLGGERRLALWRKGGPGVPPLPEELLETLIRFRAARIFFLTPAFLEGAYLPKERAFGGASVVAALVGRPQVVSGWDLKEGKPKPSRRAVPAGSVYFVRLSEAWDKGEIRAWAERTWFQNLSDGEQDRRDGFGLAALGVWDGKLRGWEEA